MSSDPRRIGILTGGGDCPGLNAVIRAVAREALSNGIQPVGIEDGFLGLIQDRLRTLSIDDIANILGQGGTILGTSNKANPARFAVGTNPDGSTQFKDVTDRVLATIEKHNLGALIAIGGDGTMSCAHHVAQRGVKVIGVPKTIDNDIVGTELTFGFLSAVNVATQAIDRVATTAESHHRVMVVEVMGRNAGWIALHAGLASGCHVILIPEIPFDINAVAKIVVERQRLRRRYTLICIAEGARSREGSQVVWRHDLTSPDPIRLGGIGRVVAESLEQITKAEARWVILGHTQRGGDPVPADRILGTIFGHYAMKLLHEKNFGQMVSMQGSLTSAGLTHVPLETAASGQRLIPITLKNGVEYPLLSAARAVGTCLGDR